MKDYQNRLICFLDVLGFSKKIETNELDDTFQKFKEFIRITKGTHVYNGIDLSTLPVPMSIPNFEEFIIVSDSIILVSYQILIVKNIMFLHSGT